VNAQPAVAFVARGVPVAQVQAAVAAEDAAEWVDATLRALSAALVDTPAARLPEIVCLRVGELGVEVLLAAVGMTL